ncbi:MAG: hypothetical protein NTU41_05285 [Chloroflexi bacterium]|nr:hypothetical protein [Chloroflexota bacterium]
MWHEEGTKIDGISLRFNPLQVTDALSVQAYQSGDYPAMVFRGTYDEGVLYRIDDLGFYGEGTLTFQFVLQKDLLYGLSSQPDEIWLDVDFGMQSSGVFKFSRQHAEGSICLQIP